MQFTECTTSYQSLMSYRKPFIAHQRAKRLSDKLGVPFYARQVGTRYIICLDFKDVEVKIADIESGLTVEFY